MQSQENKSQHIFEYLDGVGKTLEQSGYLTCRKCTCDPCDFYCSLGQGGLGEGMKNGHKTRFLLKVVNPIRLRLDPQLKLLYLLSLERELSPRLLIPLVFSPGIPPWIVLSGRQTARLKHFFLFCFLSWEVIPL